MRLGVLAGLLALLLLVLAGMPDDRYGDLPPRSQGLSALTAPPAAARAVAVLTAPDAEDPPGDDRRLAPDPAPSERIPARAGFPPAAADPLVAAPATLPERPPKAA
ncbi:hypothetical protein ACLBXP_18035 [Methylobacterium sp. A54F]